MSLSVEKAQNLFFRDNFANLAKQTFAKMWDYAKKGFFCDVILIAAENGRKITAHRDVLSAMNEFFERMFNSDFRESNEKEVLISDVSGDVLEALIGYCYTGIIDVNEKNAQLILPQASLMLFPEVVEACSLFLISIINPGNCLSMAKYAKLYNCQALIESAEDHMKEEFEKVSVTDHFLKLNQEELEEYLSFDDLDVENEKNVFEAFMKWLNHDLENRSSAISKLLPLIRLHQIKNNYLLEYVLNNHQNEGYFPLFQGIKENMFNTQLNPMSARTGKNANQIVFVCTKKIQICKLKRNVIEFSCDIPSCGSFKPTLIGEKLILVGTNKKVRCFDLNTKTWQELASILNEKSSSSVEVLNECIYAVGGWVNGTTNTVERWDSKLNRWSPVKRMNYKRQNHCTAIVNGKLYAIGGWANRTRLNSVECYDPIADSWSVCSPLLTARDESRAVAVNQEIFVFGGYSNNSGTLNCIEKYNPETNLWTKVGQMSYERQKMGAYLFNKKIYLFGGYADNWKLQKSMEEFDPISNECKLIDNPNIEYTADLYCFPYSSKNK